MMASAEDHFRGLERSGDPLTDLGRFLAQRRPDTWAHVCAVARRAVELAHAWGADVEGARLAGYGHDLAAVVPKGHMVAAAQTWGVRLTAADRAIPEVLHGPLAAAVLRQRLGIEDQDVLDAIRYHTTLRAGASRLEKVIFVADKLAYDPTTSRVDYLEAVQAGLARSLDAAAYAYLDFVVAHQKALGWRLHPNLVAAHAALGAIVANRG